MNGGIDPHTFLISAQEGGEWSAFHFGRCTPGTHWAGGRVDSRTCLDAVTIILTS